MVDAFLAYSFSLILSNTTFKCIFREKTQLFDSSDITQAQAGRRKGHGGCQWRTGRLLTTGVEDLVISVASEDDILKKTLPHD